ncbi:Alpha/Beta hydrolase protein, partial [Gorgonomyces haynaldii]
FKRKVENVKRLLSGYKTTVPVPLNVKINKLKIPILEFPEIEAPSSQTFNAEWVDVPESQNSDRVILYLHGSAYVLLSRRTHRQITWRMAKFAKARVLAIDYRLAPEHIYPAALIDVLSAYTMLLKDYQPENITFCGDSAGGGLAIAATLYLRDTKHLPMPGCVAVMSPWLDLTQSLPAWHLNDNHDYLPHRGEDPNHFSSTRYNLYVSDNSELTKPYVSPVFAKETDPLPPMLIQVGGAERPRDDGIYFATKVLRNSPITLEMYQDQPHVFQALVSFQAFSKLALERMGTFILEHTSEQKDNLKSQCASLFIRNNQTNDIIPMNASKIIDDGCDALVKLGIWTKSGDTLLL